MHVDWEYLQGVAEGAGDWKEAQLEELYQVCAGAGGGTAVRGGLTYNQLPYTPQLYVDRIRSDFSCILEGCKWI